jgi:hypothetical protein
MSRAGRQLPDDVQKPIVAACPGAESKLWSPRIRLRYEHNDCLLRVDAVAPEGLFQQSVIGTKAAVATSGNPASKFTA